MRFIFAIAFFFVFYGFKTPDWGFYGHKKINRMAVFTLPQELLAFYKKNIEYISEHAVDPDKRRYALKNEFARHYIDIDHWDVIPFDNMPRDFGEAILKFGQIVCTTSQNDTLTKSVSLENMNFYNAFIYEDRYSTDIDINLEIFKSDFPQLASDIEGRDCNCSFDNQLVKYGILPYFLEEFYNRLVYAFKRKDVVAILKISADIGHYIGDAHVPLHTTVNYNGQLTNQVGIHAFWESRLPELFDNDYDFIVGKAKYIENKREYIWDIITESHRLLEDVLEKEAELRLTFPEDQQLCFDQRLGRTIWTQCPEFSEAYHLALNGMVEDRMQDAIFAIGNFWYSAWIDAGQPDMFSIDNIINVEGFVEEQKELNQAFNKGEIYGRKH